MQHQHQTRRKRVRLVGAPAGPSRSRPLCFGAALIVVGFSTTLAVAPAFAAKASTPPSSTPLTATPTTAPGVTVATVPVPGASNLVAPPVSLVAPTTVVVAAGQIAQSFSAPAPLGLAGAPGLVAPLVAPALVVTAPVPPSNLTIETATPTAAVTLVPSGLVSVKLVPSGLASVYATVAGPATSLPTNDVTAQTPWADSKTIDWPAGTTVNDILTSFGFPGAVPTGTSSSVRPADGVVHLAVVASNPVDPLAVGAREALDALLARRTGGAAPLLVSTDAIESAFKAQLPATTSETNAELRYAKARANLALMIASRMKVSAPDLDLAWGRTDERRMVAVFAALSQVGTLYQWTGNRPGGFDCSGLTSYAWSVAGVKIPRTSTMQSDAMVPKDLAQAQPGDLLWRPGHIGMYLGAGDAMVHSPQTGKPVQVRSYGKVNRVGSFVS